MAINIFTSYALNDDAKNSSQSCAKREREEDEEGEEGIVMINSAAANDICQADKLFVVTFSKPEWAKARAKEKNQKTKNKNAPRLSYDHDRIFEMSWYYIYILFRYAKRSIDRSMPQKVFGRKCQF